MRATLITVLVLAAGCASAGTTTRPPAGPPDPRTITDTTQTACAGTSGDGQCMVLQVAGMDTLLVPEAAEVEQVAGSSEVRINLAGGASGAAIAWRADGRNLLLAAVGRPARIAIVAPKRLLIARRSWLAGENGEAMAVGSTGLAEGWTQLGSAASGAPAIPQSPDAAGAAEVPAGGDAAASGVAQQDGAAGDEPEDVTTGQTTMGDEQTQGTTPPPVGTPTPANPSGGTPPPAPY